MLKNKTEEFKARFELNNKLTKNLFLSQPSSPSKFNLIKKDELALTGFSSNSTNSKTHSVNYKKIAKVESTILIKNR